MQHNGYNKFITTIHIILQIKMNRFLFISFFSICPLRNGWRLIFLKIFLDITYDIRCEKIRQFWKWPLTRPLTGCPCHRRRWQAYCSLKAKHDYGRYEIRNPSLVLTCQLKQKTRREGSKHSAGRPLCWYHVCDVKQITRKYPCNIRGAGVV